MKKEGILRTVILSGLLAMSLGSYVFLQSHSAPAAAEETSFSVQPKDEQQERPELLLPDVALLKKAFEVTSRVLQLTR